MRRHSRAIILGGFAVALAILLFTSSGFRAAMERRRVVAAALAVWKSRGYEVKSVTGFTRDRRAYRVFIFGINSRDPSNTYRAQVSLDGTDVIAWQQLGTLSP